MRACVGGREMGVGRGATHHSSVRFGSMGRIFAMATPVVSVKLLVLKLLCRSRGGGWGRRCAYTHTHTHTRTHRHTFIYYTSRP